MSPSSAGITVFPEGIDQLSGRAMQSRHCRSLQTLIRRRDNHRSS